MGSKGAKKIPSNNLSERDTTATGGVELTFYTDPLCCWSWAMQSGLRQLRKEMTRLTNVTCKMAGLLPSWDHFNDTINSIRKPIQMGPEWMHAKAVSGAQINDKIWITDPPASSFPACIAVKCAELQSPAFAGRFLYLLQEAVMVKGLNIAKTDVLLEVATAFSHAHPSFDISSFRKDLLGDNGKNAFRKDLQECRYLGITRLPTIVFKGGSRRSVMLSGYQSYESLKNAWLSHTASPDSGSLIVNTAP